MSARINEAVISATSASKACATLSSVDVLLAALGLWVRTRHTRVLPRGEGGATRQDMKF